MGFFFTKIEPRRFRFRPFYYKPEDEKRIKFRRSTVYDPHERSRMPWVSMILLVIIALIIIALGGIRPSTRPPVLTVDNAAGGASGIDR